MKTTNNMSISCFRLTGPFGLVYLSLSTTINTYETVWEAYENNLRHVHKLFSAYFYNYQVYMIAYEDSL